MPPIKPDEVVAAKTAQIPDDVFMVFNDLIAKNFSGTSSRVHQSDVVERLQEIGYFSSDLFRNHWLDVEEAYIDAGWNVTYNAPGYNETYAATYEFSR